MAGPTVQVLGRQPDAEVVRLMRECKAFICPGEEDFGISPVEAMASGRPVVAFGAGGALETVIENETGVFFGEATGDSLADALLRVDDLEIDSERIRRHAVRFDVSHFQDRLRRLVHECTTEHRIRYEGIEPSRGREDSPLPPRSLSDPSPLWAGDGDEAIATTRGAKDVVFASNGR
jgi:hypothetical protein